MITSEVEKRIWRQLGEGWLWVESGNSLLLEELIRQLDERRRGLLESLVECEELHAIVSAERAARQYDDAEDPLAGAAEWYKASKTCFDDADEHYAELRDRIKGIGMKVLAQLFEQSQKARAAFVQLRKEAVEQVRSAMAEAKENGE